VFIGPNTILVGALALGFSGAIMTSLNVYPEVSLKMVELMKKGNVIEAMKEQSILNEFIDKVLKSGNGEWVPSMKKKFNEEFKECNLGSARKPL